MPTNIAQATRYAIPKRVSISEILPKKNFSAITITSGKHDNIHFIRTFPQQSVFDGTRMLAKRQNTIEKKYGENRLTK